MTSLRPGLQAAKHMNVSSFYMCKGQVVAILGLSIAITIISLSHHTTMFENKANLATHKLTDYEYHYGEIPELELKGPYTHLTLNSIQGPGNTIHEQ